MTTTVVGYAPKTPGGETPYSHRSGLCLGCWQPLCHRQTRCAGRRGTGTGCAALRGKRACRNDEELLAPRVYFGKAQFLQVTHAYEYGPQLGDPLSFEAKSAVGRNALYPQRNE